MIISLLAASVCRGEKFMKNSENVKYWLIR